MTLPPNPPHIVYVQSKPTNLLGVFAWITAIIAILCVPVWAAHLGIVPIVPLLISGGLTIAARDSHGVDTHLIVAVTLVGAAAVLNVLAAVFLT